MVSRINFEELIVEAAGKQCVSRTQLNHLPQLTMNSPMGVTSKCGNKYGISPGRVFPDTINKHTTGVAD